MNISDFLKTYGAAIPLDIFLECVRLQKRGVTHRDMPVAVFRSIEREWQARRESEKLLDDGAERNRQGMEAERAGDLATAIDLYEENVDAHAPLHHHYRRLVIIYRKAHDFDNEIRVLEQAIAVFPDHHDYRSRMRQAEQKALKKRKDRPKGRP